MYFVDAHIHSHISPDASGSIDELCRAAVEKGLNHIYITDHCDVNGWEGKPYDFMRDGAYSEICLAREKYRGRLKIGFGAELGQEQQNPALAKETLDDARLDFVIGSLHNLAGQPDFFFLQGKELDSHMTWLRYFEQLYEHVKKSDFDVLGHITYPKRYIETRWCGEYDEFTDAVLREVLRRGKGIEINTSGLRQNIDETLPPLWMVKRYRELGGKFVTIGSDSHQPEHVGFKFEEGCQIARAAGIRYLAVYEGRKAEYLTL